MPIGSDQPPDLSRARASRRAVIAGALALPLMGFKGFDSLFAPKAELWERWQQHDPSSSVALDWSDWDAWLGRHVMAGPDGINRFDYSEINGAERAALDAIIDRLAAVTVSTLNRDQQFAYWVNLYNAVTLRLVLDHYPVESIRDIKLGGGFFAAGPWDTALVTVEDTALTLNDIEHRILRPIWRDPRIHYAVNCASLGCPNLKPEAWVAESLDTDLDAAARAFVRHPRGLSIERRADTFRVRISKIYTWFDDDFATAPGQSERGILEHLQRYAAPETAQQLAELARIDSSDYDWSLNDAGRVD